jgi:hypothetical protein
MQMITVHLTHIKMSKSQQYGFVHISVSTGVEFGKGHG